MKIPVKKVLKTMKEAAVSSLLIDYVRCSDSLSLDIRINQTLLLATIPGDQTIEEVLEAIGGGNHFCAYAGRRPRGLASPRTVSTVVVLPIK